MSAPPIPFEWTGSDFKPVGRFAKDCDRHFVVGERYILVVQEERSMTSHRHEFAWLREAWLNLPESLADQYPTAEHLRKKALVHTGYYTREDIVVPTRAEALRTAALLRRREEYAVVVVDGNVVSILTPKSQSLRAMGKQEFQESKDKIMGWVSSLVGVSPEELQRNSGKAA